MRKARKKDPGVPDILDRWAVGMEDGIWLGLVEVEMEIVFASFRSGVSRRHPDGDSQNVSETGG